MNRKVCLALVVGLAVVAFRGTANAETLLGKNYIGGTFAIVQYGDDEIDDLVGNGYGVAGTGNINLNPNIDLRLGLAYLWADGDEAGVEIDVSALGADATLNYFLRPGEQINPYVGAGIMLVKTEVEASALGVSRDEDETDVGFGAGAGVEIEATQEILVRLGLDYFTIDSEDSIDVAVSLGYWFNEQVMGGIGGSYDFDSEDAVAQIGIVVKM